MPTYEIAWKEWENPRKTYTTETETGRNIKYK